MEGISWTLTTVSRQGDTEDLGFSIRGHGEGEGLFLQKANRAPNPESGAGAGGECYI